MNALLYLINCEMHFKAQLSRFIFQELPLDFLTGVILDLLRCDQTGSTYAYSFPNQCLHLYLEPPDTQAAFQCCYLVKVDDAVDKYLSGAQ